MAYSGLASLASLLALCISLYWVQSPPLEVFWFILMISCAFAWSADIQYDERMALHQAPPRTRHDAIERTREMLERIQLCSDDSKRKQMSPFLRETVLILLRSKELSLSRAEEQWLMEGFQDISRVAFTAIDQSVFLRYVAGAIPLQEEVDMYLAHFEKRVLKLIKVAE